MSNKGCHQNRNTLWYANIQNENKISKMMTNHTKNVKFIIMGYHIFQKKKQ